MRKDIRVPVINAKAIDWCLFAPEAITGVDGASPGADELTLGACTSSVATGLTAKVVEMPC
jgi:hypothetical protein